MVRSKITYYAMLTPERRAEIQQEIQARQAARAAGIAAGEEEEMALMEVEEAE